MKFGLDIISKIPISCFVFFLFFWLLYPSEFTPSSSSSYVLLRPEIFSKEECAVNASTMSLNLSLSVMTFLKSLIFEGILWRLISLVVNSYTASRTSLRDGNDLRWFLLATFLLIASIIARYLSRTLESGRLFSTSRSLFVPSLPMNFSTSSYNWGLMTLSAVPNILESLREFTNASPVAS